MIRKINFEVYDIDKFLLESNFECVYMHLAEDEDNWQCDYHKHEYMEIGYVFGGSGIYRIEDKEYEAGKDDVFVVPAFKRHFERSKDNGHFEPMFIMINTHTTYVDKIQEIICDISGKNDIADHKDIRVLFSDIYNELILQKPGYLSVIDAKVKLLILALYRLRHHISLGDIEKTSSARRMYVLEQIKDYVTRNIAEPLTVESVAQQFYYHPKSLSRIFKAETGQTLSEYITEKKLSKIKELLKRPEMTIEEISNFLSFSSLQYFYKLFKRAEGITPKQYREKYMNAPRDAF